MTEIITSVFLGHSIEQLGHGIDVTLRFLVNVTDTDTHLSREFRFGSKVGQIGPKSDKSWTF